MKNGDGSINEVVKLEYSFQFVRGTYCNELNVLTSVAQLGKYPRGAGYSRLQVMGMIEWGQKSKPKKIPGPKINAPKNLMANF